MVENNIMLEKGGLKIAHLNICSLWNKVSDISEIIQDYNLQILVISETHLDSAINSTVLNIDGYNIYRQDRNLYGGVACYVQSQIPVIVQRDLTRSGSNLVTTTNSTLKTGPHCMLLQTAKCYNNVPRSNM